MNPWGLGGIIGAGVRGGRIGVPPSVGSSGLGGTGGGCGLGGSVGALLGCLVESFLSMCGLFLGLVALIGGLRFAGGEVEGDLVSNISTRESTLGESGGVFTALSADRPRAWSSTRRLTTLGAGTGPVGGGRYMLLCWGDAGQWLDSEKAGAGGFLSSMYSCDRSISTRLLTLLADWKRRTCSSSYSMGS